MVRAYLAGPGDAYLKRLEKYPALLREADQMRALCRARPLRVQHTQEGYGHAVFQTRAFAAGEPVLLCLGDHLFRGRPVSPYRELAEVGAAANGRSVSAVNRIGADELKGYGTIAGTRRTDDPRLIDVSLIIEKPDVATARAKLHVDDLPPDTWLGWFGMHLLGPVDLRRARRDDPRRRPRQRRVSADPRAGNPAPARRVSGRRAGGCRTV